MWRIKGKPYEVQRRALEKSNGREGFGFLMEMGLGKTATTLNEFMDLLHEDKVDGLVVICPPSLKDVWMKELKEWGVWIDGTVWTHVPSTDKPFILIINYEAFSSGACKGYSYLHKLLQQRRVYVALDESTQIKNPQSVRTKHLLTLAPFCKFRRILSGAPMTQGPHDLWAQLRFIGAIKGMNFYAFRNRFCKMGGWMAKQVVGARNSEELAQILDEWCFRAKKADWTDLPEKIYTVRSAEMSPAQKKAYEVMKRDFILFLSTEQSVEAPQVITQLIKLQQITSGFIIDEHKELFIIEPKPAKLKVLLEVMEEVEGKVLVFAVFRHTISLLKEALGEYQPAIMVGEDDFKRYGTTLDAEKDRFANDPLCRVFIIQTQTGKYGHTLLGSKEHRCSTSVFYENSYSLDDRLQAEDRNHRYGQDKAVVYIDMISSPVDAACVNALQKKGNIASEVIDKFRERKA